VRQDHSHAQRLTLDQGKMQTINLLNLRNWLNMSGDLATGITLAVFNLQKYKLKNEKSRKGRELKEKVFREMCL